MQAFDSSFPTYPPNQPLFHGPDLPTCAVCMEKLGTYGGPSSLPCGHNGCLLCLQQVQAHNVIPLCPLCRMPFDADLNLGLNLDLREMLETLQLASSSHLGFNKVVYDENDGYNHHIQQVVSSGKSSRLFPAISADALRSHSPESGGISSVVGNAVMSNTTLKSDANNVQKIYNNNNLQGRRYPDSSMMPQVNIQNVLRGTLAVLSRKARSFLEQSNVETRQSARDSPSSVEEPSNEDLWTSMSFPSAPPLLAGCGEDASALRAILESEPPQWVPDSACDSCMQCRAIFQPLRRGRHHCRLCGGIFCSACSKGKCLMPAKFRVKDPQRVCDECYERLEPVQQILIGTVSNAAQIAIHDVTDITCMRAWLNNPLGSCMQDDIYKATNILKAFSKIGRLKPEQSIPQSILQGAHGLVVLTVAKVGMVMTYKLGTGLLVARRQDGSWSPPLSIMSAGLGWGLQVGGELIDFVIVLHSSKAVKAFTSRIHLSIGAGVSACAGPLGRVAEADLRVSSGGVATCYTYSCSQGAFVGASFEGNIVGPRPYVNACFYGDTYLTPDDILFGSIPLPRAADPLYKALQELFSSLDL